MLSQHCLEVGDSHNIIKHHAFGYVGPENITVPWGVATNAHVD